MERDLREETDAATNAVDKWVTLFILDFFLERIWENCLIDTSLRNAITLARALQAMALSTFEKWLYELGFFLPIYRLRKDIDRKLVVLEGLVDDIERYSGQARNQGENILRENYSRMLFVLLLDYDVALQLHDTLREFDSRRKNYRVRQLCLILHEGFENIPVVLGHRFRQLVATLPNGVMHVEKLSAALKALSKLSKGYEALLKQVRNEVAAHREHDALRQLEVHRQIPMDEIQKLAAAFDLELARLSEVLLPIVHELGVEALTRK